MSKSLVAIVVAGCALAAAASAAAPARASTPVVYPVTDTTPDVAGAPDVSSVTVSDTSTGLITVQVTFSPGTAQPSSDSFSLYIDSDQNPSTGDLGGTGTDYLIEYDGPPDSFGLYKWDGKSAYAPVDRTSAKITWNGDNYYFVFAASELGITDGFNFNVAAGVGSDTASSSQVDYVPDDGTNLHYALQNRLKVAVTLSVADWEYSTPRAGKPFVTALFVKRSDTGALLTRGAPIRCKLALAGKTVALYDKLFHGVPSRAGGTKPAALCDWHLPAGSAGRRLVATESVTLGAATVSKTFVLQIRK